MVPADAASLAIDTTVLRNSHGQGLLAHRASSPYNPPMIPFHKMHGLGNDFVVFDARPSSVVLDEPAARAVADRRLGIGCDQVVVIERRRNRGDAVMRIFNADGREVEACGNAARCVARLLMAEQDRTDVEIDSAGGLLFCRDAGDGNVTVDMGTPKFGWQDIPLAEAADTKAITITIDGVEFDATALSLGNPHCVIFVENADSVALSSVGPQIESHPLFPNRVNVEFVSMVRPGQLRLRVWERGAGATRACGTGACASVAASVRRGLGLRTSDVLLDGGISPSSGERVTITFCSPVPRLSSLRGK